MEFDLNKPHCHYFYEISKIPHGSCNEKALSDWIVRFAQEHRLTARQDELGNVVVYKKASAGYEDHPGVIIQAHMDMVCEKTPESQHNFLTDPLDLYVSGTHLRARGTTLGGDDCMGVAYMLDILADDCLPHPYLECCFTVQEENGLIGAMALKPEYFRARRLINLDGAGEYRTYTTLAGARNMEIEKKLTMSESKDPAYRLSVTGLLGGRTGDDIGKERANAGKLAARVLVRMLESGAEIRIAEFTSANKKAGIATDAEVTFTSGAPREALQAALSAVASAAQEEYELSDPDIRLTLEPSKAILAATPAQSGQLAKLIYLLPNGVFLRFLPLDGLPSFSANTGKIVKTDTGIKIAYAARSPFESCMDEAQSTVQILCEQLDAQITTLKDYYGYRYRKDSPLRDVMDRVFMQQYGKPLLHVAAHGGNECGVFMHMFPDMDIVTTGAIYALHHTTEEYLDLESFDRSIRFLKAFVSNL